MTTLIIGCGYLGQRVGALLCQRGERVFGTVRSARRAADLAKDGIEPMIADVLDLESLGRLPAADRVFYAVGFDRVAGPTMRTVYVDGLQNVLNGLSSQTTRLVYASSTGVYGQSGDEWVNEESPTIPATESGKVCLAAECRVRAWANSRIRTAQAIILRYSGLYGPGRVVRRSLIERGEPIAGDPGKFLNLIHIDDAAQAALAALETTAEPSLYLIADDRPVTRYEYYSLIARLLGAPEPRFEIPRTGTPGESRDASNKRISNHRMREQLGLTLRYPDILAGVPVALDPR
jgi:nucleoside-diphosphate-sugar epimerase